MTERTTIPVAEASASQLRDFAQTMLGLDVPLTATIATIRARMTAAGWEGEEISIAAPSIARSPSAETGPSPDEEEYVTIIIDKTAEKGGDQSVPVSVNGRMLLIERGKPQRIRRCYERVLATAIATVYEQEGGISSMIPRDVPRIPYRLVA